MLPVGLAPFVRRREQTTGLTYVAPVHNKPTAPEEPLAEGMIAAGGSGYTPSPNPVNYGSFTGGRGRPVYPGTQDSTYQRNEWTMLGGEGASWEWEHYGVKMPLMSPAKSGDPGTYGAANHPLDGYPGMVAWPERANEYKPPYMSYGGLVDQRTGNVSPDWTNANGANPLV